MAVQGNAPFTYEVTPDDFGIAPRPPGDIQSVPARWRCNLPGCTEEDWYGAVINWPASSAYSSNNRPAENSRTVYSESGELLYPYMGSWADGCEVTATSGTIIIIEWQRGAAEWRRTWLEPGDTHVINLTGSENGAMIETFEFSPGFSVSLNNCTPQPLP